MTADFQQLPSWRTLVASAQARRRAATDHHLSAIPTLRRDGITVDMAKQLIDEHEWASLVALAHDTGLENAIERQFNGTFANESERKTVQHARLRTPLGSDPALNAEVAVERERMLEFAEAVRDGRHRGYTGQAITTVINIGIGGSHLGPEVLFNAFTDAKVDVRFLANIDGAALARSLAGLDPHRTLVIVASKSFGTLEALENARAVRSWFIERGAGDAITRQFIAVTERPDRAAAIGIDASLCFRLWDWVGGRYSVWSSIGLSTAIAFGAECFQSLLAGAHSLDEHFRDTDLQENLPVRLALVALWNSEFLRRGTHLVLPYDRRLKDVPTYLQQLELESNGKRVTRNGARVRVDTAPFIWGGEETNGQHAFHQFLLQGTRQFSADFIAVSEPGTRHVEHHRWLLANCFAQSQAMRFGNAPDTETHKLVPGGTPSSTILIDRLTPHTLGFLLAAYEQKVFCLGHLWQINSFDQWGVELGKTLAEPIFDALAGKTQNDHPATAPLITQARATRPLD